MKEKMNVLFIAPSHTMVSVTEAIAADYPFLDTTVVVGNEDTGKKRALESYADNYDCIISRGNTAALIRQAVFVPVIEVKVTLGDMLGSLAEAPQLPQIVAVVGYRNAVTGVDAMKHFLPFALEVYGFSHTSELLTIFSQLHERNIQTIVCDTITYELASAQGFDPYILRSSEDSIRYAFEQVMLLFQSNRSILEENQLLRQLNAVNSESETVVFDHNWKLFYSSLSAQNAFLMEQLHSRLPDFEVQDKFRIVRHRMGYQYRISAKKIRLRSGVYFAYFICRRTPDMQASHKGIRYTCEQEIQQEMHSSVFRIAGLDYYYSTQINQALARRNPVLIFGEVGVGKNHLAELIYLNSNYTKNPFIFIDFTLLNRQTWDYLINRNDSPLCDNGNTLFLKNIDALAQEQLVQLLASLEESDAAKRNRLIISCSARKDGVTLPYLQLVMYQLSCLPIHMHPLRNRFSSIKSAVLDILEYLQNEEGLPAGPPSEEAMEELVHYSWPQNYLQLVRVMRKAAMVAGTGTIQKEHITDILTTEMYFAQGETTQTANTILDLTKPLSEINADIVRLLVEQYGGNHTMAAKSLGISRTTVWRMLKTAPTEITHA